MEASAALNETRHQVASAALEGKSVLAAEFYPPEHAPFKTGRVDPGVARHRRLVKSAIAGAPDARAEAAFVHAMHARQMSPAQPYHYRTESANIGASYANGR